MSHICNACQCLLPKFGQQSAPGDVLLTIRVGREVCRIPFWEPCVFGDRPKCITCLLLVCRYFRSSASRGCRWLNGICIGNAINSAGGIINWCRKLAMLFPVT